jgi:hypothetical protein
MPMHNRYPQNMQAIRNAFIIFLSVREKTASYDRTEVNEMTFRHTWTVLRREILTIDGKPINTIALEEDIQSGPNYKGYVPRQGYFLRWLAPKDGLWVKAEFHLIQGSVIGVASYATYEDVAISQPQ